LLPYSSQYSVVLFVDQSCILLSAVFFMGVELAPSHSVRNISWECSRLRWPV